MMLHPFLLLIGFPFEVQPPETWFKVVQDILNIFYALSIKGYLLFILVGFIIFATGISDGLAKGLVGFGVVLYFVGPMLLNLIASLSGVEPITMETATATWIRMMGLSEMELLSLFVWLGEMVAAICCLAGAILYFTPASNDLNSRGRTLIVRALMIAPVLAFIHIAPFL
jgi:hypothetical protein